MLRSASGVAKVLRRHHLATRRARVSALAILTGADTGLVAERNAEPFGFCLAAAKAGDLVGLDCFYVGKLKGIGPIYQLTAVDTATRWAICELVIGHVNSEVAAAFCRHVAQGLLALGAALTGVLSDNGPEFRGGAFAAACRESGITHHRTWTSATARPSIDAGSTRWPTSTTSCKTSSTATTPAVRTAVAT